MPTWTDAGGWTDPSQYSTIQLADFNGDGRDKLLARNDQGLTIWWFDTSLGQWRPQVDGDATPQSSNDCLRAPTGREAGYGLDEAGVLLDDPDRAHQRQQAGADPRALRRRDARLRLPARAERQHQRRLVVAGQQGGPFGDAAGWNEPSRYLTILTAELVPGVTDLVGRSRAGLVTYDWNGSGWSPRPVPAVPRPRRFADANCGVPSCFDLFRAATSGAGAQRSSAAPPAVRP